MDSTLASNNNKRVERWFALVLTLWAGVVVIAGYYGLFARLPLPSIGILATVGIAVPIVLYYRYIVFHVFSLLDFVGAVGTGLTFTLLQVPLMENIATFPLVLIPLYGVCVTGALSWMALDTFLRR